MNEFTHVRMILGFILSHCLAQLLRGASKLIVHPTRSRLYWVHLLWTFYVFLDIIFFWWWEYQLYQISRWTFGMYLLVIMYIILYYILCSLLFPDDISEYQGYRDYYYARRQWFFGIVAFTYPIDALDAYIKNGAHIASMSTIHIVRTVLCTLLCLVAVYTSNERYHALLAIVLIGDIIFWIIGYNQLF